MENFEPLLKLGQIILVDLILAGDNAIVIGLVAAQFTAEHRRRVILYGVGVAVVLRIVFAMLTVQLLAIKGLLLVGGLLLLWICWKLWVELRKLSSQQSLASAGDETGNAAHSKAAGAQSNPPLIASILQVVVADLSMSLDNVLAVAAIADGDLLLLAIGLAIAIVFMTFAAALIATTLHKHRWIGYVGLAVIVYVGLQMTCKGITELLPLDACFCSLGML